MNAPSRTEQYIRSLDTREMPRYTPAQVARYVGVPESTLRTWFFGYYVPSRDGHRRHMPPIIHPANARKELLCFYDAASAHVLVAFKNKNVALADIRYSLKSLTDIAGPTKYPLLSEDFFLLGKEIVIKRHGARINLTKGNQLGIRKVVDVYLSRIERDEHTKLPVRFYPIRSVRTASHPGWVVIDPEISYGRPVVRGTGIMAEVIAKRRQSGESISLLSADYRLSRRAIEEAIKYFQQPQAA